MVLTFLSEGSDPNAELVLLIFSTLLRLPSLPHLKRKCFGKTFLGAEAPPKYDTAPIGFSNLLPAAWFMYKKVLCPIQQCSHMTIYMRNEHLHPCYSSCIMFLESHYFWINLCWWQFHCLLLWLILLWSLYFIAILCSQLFLFFFFLSFIININYWFPFLKKKKNLLKIARSVIVVLANAMKERTS